MTQLAISAVSPSTPRAHASAPASLYVGAQRALQGRSVAARFTLPAHHLVTHGVIVGMTGSGKTGLLTVFVEEALRSRVPTLVLDVKGDLTNLLLAGASLSAEGLTPWLAGTAEPGDPRSDAERAGDLVAARKADLAEWTLGEADVAAYCAGTRFRVLTPGSTAGEAVHVLSSLEARSPRWDDDPESARAALSAAVSLVMRLLGREPDPAKSREHVLLSVLAERRHTLRLPCDLGALLEDLEAPPLERLGALALDAFSSKRDRRALAAALNSLLASPTFASWRTGASLDVGAWLAPADDGRTPCVVLSVAHLDDDERALVLGMVLEETLSWVRSLPGASSLRALVAFDEVYGFLPPYPHAPPTKRPLVALLKQARAFGVGLLLATQNPMDLDYRALSNAGLWCVGRLQTDADRARVVEGLAGIAGERADATAGATSSATSSATNSATRASGAVADAATLDDVIKRLSPRWFVVRDAQGKSGTLLVRPRTALTWLRGPLTRGELVRARAAAV